MPPSTLVQGLHRSPGFLHLSSLAPNPSAVSAQHHQDLDMCESAPSLPWWRPPAPAMDLLPRSKSSGSRGACVQVPDSPPPTLRPADMMNFLLPLRPAHHAAASGPLCVPLLLKLPAFLQAFIFRLLLAETLGAFLLNSVTLSDPRPHPCYICISTPSFL